MPRNIRWVTNTETLTQWYTPYCCCPVRSTVSFSPKGAITVHSAVSWISKSCPIPPMGTKGCTWREHYRNRIGYSNNGRLLSPKGSSIYNLPKSNTVRTHTHKRIPNRAVSRLVFSGGLRFVPSSKWCIVSLPDRIACCA